MKKFLIMATLILSVTFGGNAKAGLITISVDQDNVAIGEMIELTLNATDFDAFDSFDISVDFDTNLFEFLTFTTDLPGLALVFPFDSFGIVIGYSDFTPSSGSLLLGTIKLMALEAGSTSFNLMVNEFSLSDPNDNLAVGTSVSADVSRPAFASVPEPGTFAIMFIALVSLVSLKRKRQKISS